MPLKINLKVRLQFKKKLLLQKFKKTFESEYLKLPYMDENILIIEMKIY